jgi:hypothetical protein
LIPRPHTPAVLIVIDANGRLSVLQDAGVQIVLLDERVDPEFVTLLPQRDQKEELLLILGGKYPVSLGNDHAGTAANAYAQLLRHRILIGSLEPDAILSQITHAQEASR